MVSAGRADERAPCLIGAGQVVARSSDPLETEPINLWAEACSLAIADTGARRGVTAFGLGGLSVVYCGSWSYDSPAQRLARRLGVTPPLLADSGMGGDQPQLLLHTMADAIAGGQMDLGLMVSGEALHTVDVSARENRPLPWNNPASPPPAMDIGAYVSDDELRHGMLPVMRSFALRDSARRAHLGISPEEYADEPAPAYAAMSSVAADNPYAWRPAARSAGEILRVHPGNRMPVRPYTKLMMASPNVNQAAALLIASQAAADAIGVPTERRVYLRGWSAARDYPYVAQNADLWRSRAMEDASHRVLGAAGMHFDDIDHLDLYSCFPSALRFAADALGCGIDDRRGLSVTGGMPYAGAPGSGYVTQALATMTQTLRDHAGASGLVGGLSGQMATYAFSLLSTNPSVADPTALGAAGAHAPRGEPMVVRPQGDGPATLEAYAVACDRAGADELGVAVCRLPDDSRCYAQTRDAGILSWLSTSEGVGHRVHLTTPADGPSLIEV